MRTVRPVVDGAGAGAAWVVVCLRVEVVVIMAAAPVFAGLGVFP
jgi:hypothetical protein